MYDILAIIGRAAINTNWLCKDTECLGKGAKEMYVCDDNKVRVSGKELFRITSQIYQTIEGYFAAYRCWAEIPWLIIRAVDGSGFAVSTSNRRIVAHLKERFRDIEDSESYQQGHTCVFVRSFSGKERSPHVQKAIDMMLGEEAGVDFESLE